MTVLKITFKVLQDLQVTVQCIPVPVDVTGHFLLSIKT